MSKDDSLRLVVEAAMRLDARTPAWRNLVAMIGSVYGGKVTTYDLAGAEASLASLPGNVQHALIEWVLQVASIREQKES